MMESIALQFLLDTVPSNFHSDTNVFVAGCFICLAWPQIEISGGELKVVVNCPRDKGEFARDDTPLIPFLKSFPDVCLSIVEAHPALRQSFLEYCGSVSR
ncbi:hypothetical protein [Paraburkholderia caballeronis]|nr:hypothetical protein [Paraburkholderia caballeronis]